MSEIKKIQSEFKGLLWRARWKPADASRALHLTPATMSRYVNGLSKPKPHTMELLRRLVADKEAHDSDPTLLEAHQAPSDFQIAGIVRALDRCVAELTALKHGLTGPTRPVAAATGRKASSEAAAAGKERAKRVLAAGLRGLRGRRPSPGADAPSAPASRPRRGTRPRSGRRPALAGQAQAALKGE